LLNREQPTPLYYQLVQILLAKIREMAPHTRLPSEAELMAAYQVSRGTAKQALVTLEQQGLVYRIQGKGTFVAEPRISRSFEQVPSFSEDIRRLGYRPGIRLLALEVMPAPAKVSERLGLDPAISVWRVERVFLADGEPLAHAISFVRQDLFPELDAQGVGVSLYQTLQRQYGTRPVWARDTYTAVPVRGRTARLLGFADGGVALYSERIAYTEQLLPVEYVESWIRGDRFTLTVNRMPPEQSGSEAHSLSR